MANLPLNWMDWHDTIYLGNAVGGWAVLFTAAYGVSVSSLRVLTVWEFALWAIGGLIMAVGGTLMLTTSDRRPGYGYNSEMGDE